MIELHELRQFAAFAEYGTLSEAAEALHLSQPALSRSMKKLEDELGIPLFVRHKNKLELNGNGTCLLAPAKQLLADAEAHVREARLFDRKNRTISFGLCSPAPGWIVTPLLGSLYQDKTIQTEIAEEAALRAGLENGTYQLAAFSRRPEEPQFFSMPCGRESLAFALPPGHRYAGRKSLSFAQMNGESMLLMDNIGFWNFVRTEKMPASRFLTQHDSFSFHELLRSSTLPAFTTDLAKNYLRQETDRVEVPISDPEASVTYHLVCLKEAAPAFRGLFAAL